jgi:hypothetical protein
MGQVSCWVLEAWHGVSGALEGRAHEGVWGTDG